MTNAQRAEITDFQTAAKLNSAPAWRKFLEDYPVTVFRGFVETHMGDEPAKTLPAPAPTATPMPAQGDHEQTSAVSGWRGMVLLLGGLAFLTVMGFTAYKFFGAPKPGDTLQIASVEAKSVPVETGTFVPQKNTRADRAAYCRGRSRHAPASGHPRR